MGLITCTFGNCIFPQRYVLCFMCFAAILNGYTMRVSLNIALTEMVAAKPPKNASDDDDGGCPPDLSPPVPVKGGIYNWTEKQQGLILGAFFPGYVITQIPGGAVSDTLGGKHVLGFGVLLSAVVTALTPLGVEIGDWWMLMILRFIMGVAQGVIFPSVNTLLANWVPKSERSTLGSLVLTGPQVGSILGNLLTAYLIAFIGNWKIVYYFWAVVALMWYVLFMLVCFNEPRKHPFISPKEREMLEGEIGAAKKYKIPWMKLFLYPPSLALTVAQMGHGILFFMIVTDLPKYFKDVLKFNIKENGALNALTYLAMWVCSGFSGLVTDMVINRDMATVTFMRKLNTTLGSVLPSTCIVLAGYMGCDRAAASAMFIMAMFFKGPFYAGVRVNALDITKNFAGILMAFFNGMGSLAFVPVPYLIGVIAKNNTVDEWRIVFWLVFAASGITNIIYVIWGSGERAEWDLNPEEIT